MSMIVLCTLMLMTMDDATHGKLPLSFTAMVEARSSDHAGRVHWWQVSSWGLKKHYISRVAENGDAIFEVREGNGEDHLGPALRILQGKDAFFVFHESGTSAKQWGPGHESLHVGQIPYRTDLRHYSGAGLWPTAGSIDYMGGPTWVLAHPELDTAEWSERSEDGLRIVTARNRAGATFTWHIDADKGWNPVKVVAEYRSGDVLEAVSTLEEQAGVWFPRQVKYYKNGEPAGEIRVTEARFGPGVVPERFTLNDLGVEPGSAVLDQGIKEPQIPPVWNGETITSHREFVADVQAGKRQWGPLHLALRNGPLDGPNLTEQERRENLLARRKFQTQARLSGWRKIWTDYVNQAIEKYSMDDEQAQKARAILSQCIAEGERVLAPLTPRLTALVKRQVDARAEGRTQDAIKIDEQISQEMAPLQQIFAQRLRPRIESLPTRSQRHAAGEPIAP